MSATLKHSSLIWFALLIIAGIICPAFMLEAQVYVHDWKSHGSYIQINQITYDSRYRVWFACDGGAMMFDPVDSTITKYDNLNHLSVINLTACAGDTSMKEVYFGAKDGTIEIISEEGVCTHITDIKTAAFADPKITSIVFKDTVAYISGNFGIASFDTKRKIFIETAVKLGALSPNVPVNRIRIFGNTLYAATNSCVASASLSDPIANPASWKNYSYAPGYTPKSTLDVYLFQDSLYIIENPNLLVNRGGSFAVKRTVVDYPPFAEFLDYKGKLYFNNQFIFFSATDNDDFVIDWKPVNKCAVIHKPEGDILIAENVDNGFFVREGDTYKTITYPSPKWSNFGNLSIDATGRVWCASGSNFMILDPATESWQHMKLGNGLGGDQRRIAFRGVDNKIFSTSWGQGMFISEEKNDTLASVQFNETNSPLLGIPTKSTYVVVGETCFDKNNVFWTINNTIRTDGYGLLAIDSKNNFHTFEGLEAPGVKVYYALAIDPNGTKWLGSTENGGSLAYYNENNTLDDKSDDQYGVLGSYTLAQNSIVRTIAIDKSGYVWYGSPTGVSCLINTSFFRYKQSPIIRKINLMTGHAVNAIMVDATDNKWIATNDGIWVLNPDGSEVLLHLTTSNSPLISNEVLSITQDKATGKVFAGTPLGLNEMSTTSMTANWDYDIKCSPQPFVPSRDVTLIIDGLSIDSQVRILTTDGELVKAIETTSRQITWDGRDENGNEAASGVYIVVASSTSTKNTGVGKIALVRK